MTEESRKNYRKLSLESIIFSAIGVVLLMVVCGTPGGAIRYIAREAYQIILVIAGVVFVVGVVGLLVTLKHGKEEDR